VIEPDVPSTFHLPPPEKYLKKLVGEREIEDALKRLDQWTQEEAWIGYAQILKTTHNVNEKLNNIDDKVNEAIASK